MVYACVFFDLFYCLKTFYFIALQKFLNFKYFIMQKLFFLQLYVCSP